MAWIAGSGSVTRHAKRAIAFRFFAHGPVVGGVARECPGLSTVRARTLWSRPPPGSAAPVALPLLLFVCRVTCGCGWVFLHLCHGLASSVVVLSLPSVIAAKRSPLVPYFSLLCRCPIESVAPPFRSLCLCARGLRPRPRHALCLLCFCCWCAQCPRSRLSGLFRRFTCILRCMFGLRGGILPLPAATDLC